MDSFTVVIQMLSIVALLVVIGFFSIGIYISIVIASRLKEILAILDTAKSLNEKIKQLQSNVSSHFGIGLSRFVSVIMNILTTILYHE